MKLIRTYANGKKPEQVAVPEELEPFVNYMFSRGYSEPTIAMIVRDVRLVMKKQLSEKDLELMSGKTASRLRYAWRHYRNFQKLMEGA